jgi:hypothetical protein
MVGRHAPTTYLAYSAGATKRLARPSGQAGEGLRDQRRRSAGKSGLCAWVIDRNLFRLEADYFAVLPDDDGLAEKLVAAQGLLNGPTEGGVDGFAIVEEFPDAPARHVNHDLLNSLIAFQAV